MSDHSLPPLGHVAAVLQRDLPGVSPAELHGSLCGFLSAGPAPGREDWLVQVMSDATLDAPQAGDPLDCLYQASLAQLDSPDFDFELLLPDESAPVSERGDALVEWCRGFLGGFGLGAARTTALSEDAEEALADIGRIAASDLDYDDPEADAAAFEEVVEFIRVAVLLLHSDCVLGPRHRRKLN